MALGGFITIEFVARGGDGKLVPNIDPADLADLQRFAVHEDVIGRWHFAKGGHHVTLTRRPDFGGNKIFEVVCSTDAAWNQITNRVASQAFDFGEAANRPAAQDQWLTDNGYQRVERASAPGTPVAILPGYAISGQNMIGVATHGLPLVGDDAWSIV